MSFILLVAASIIQFSGTCSFSAWATQTVVSRTTRGRVPAAISTPKAPLKNRVEGKAELRPESLKLQPAAGAEVPRGLGPTWFELTRNGDVLVLSFMAKDPAWVLNPAPGSVLVQVFADPPAEVSPGTIRGAQWPANSTRVQLKLTGSGRVDSAQNVHGQVMYSYCKRGTQECKKTVSKFRL